MKGSFTRYLITHVFNNKKMKHQRLFTNIVHLCYFAWFYDTRMQLGDSKQDVFWLRLAALKGNTWNILEEAQGHAVSMIDLSQKKFSLILMTRCQFMKNETFKMKVGVSKDLYIYRSIIINDILFVSGKQCENIKVAR